MDAAASCAQRDRRAGDEPVSDQQHADERRLQRTAKSCGPDAPTLASSSRMLCRPYRASDTTQVRKRRWQKSPVTGESTKEPVKTIACGNAGRFRCTRCYSCAFYHSKCTRGRGCSGHPAFPTPSWGRKIHQRLGRLAPRERSRMRNYINVIASAAKQSILSLRGEMDCFAALAMTAVRRHTLSCHRPRRRTIQYSRDAMMQSRSRGVLDTPLEPVIGLAEGETRWRGMTVVGWAKRGVTICSDTHRDKFCSRKFSAVEANTCMLATRSSLPVSSVIATCSTPATPMQLWPAASP